MVKVPFKHEMTVAMESENTDDIQQIARQLKLTELLEHGYSS